MILRGTRSAGYGFVAVATAEATEKAVELLDKKELDGRPVIVEVAKPADQKDKEKKQKRFKRRPGRRGSKAVPGEISEAEANGDAEKPEGATPAGDEAAKPKKKKKNNVSCVDAHSQSICLIVAVLSSVSPSARQPLQLMEKLLRAPKPFPRPMVLPKQVRKGRSLLASLVPPALPARLERTLLASLPRVCCSSPTSVLTSTMRAWRPSSPMRAFTSARRALSAVAGENPAEARGMALSM